MRTNFLVGMLLAASSLLAAPRVSIGIGLGGYGYVPPPVVYAPPYPVYSTPYPVYATPYPGYSWVGGYWYNVGPRRLWRAGYWAPPAYAGRGYYGGGYYRGGYRGTVVYRGGYRSNYRGRR